MDAKRFVRDALLGGVVLAMLAIGGAAAATAEDVDAGTYHDVVTADVAESFPEPAPGEPAPVAGTRGLVTQAPPTSWNPVVGSPCLDPEPLCDALP